MKKILSLLSILLITIFSYSQISVPPQGLKISSGNNLPNNQVFGSSGDLYMSKSGNIGSTWLKVRGANTKTGWVKIDTVGSGGGAGTVTSIATSTGITGGTITTTGTLKADTSLLSTHSYVNHNAWGLTGNSGTTSSNFIGTTDGQPLFAKSDSFIFATNGFNSGIFCGKLLDFGIGQNSGGAFGDSVKLYGRLTTRVTCDPNGLYVNEVDTIFDTCKRRFISADIITLTGVTKTLIKNSLQIQDGTQASGYVLTSDANGLASWQNPTNKIVAHGDSLAQTTDIDTLCTFTTAADGIYSVGGYVDITAIAGGANINLFYSFTDGNNQVRTINITGALSSATFTPTTTRNFKAKSGTIITLLTTGNGSGSITYDAGGYITKVY